MAPSPKDFLSLSLFWSPLNQSFGRGQALHKEGHTETNLFWFLF
jgi:hypothetical protein